MNYLIINNFPLCVIKKINFGIGYVSLEGHYPMSQDENFQKYLTIGPMTRFADDLLLLLKVMTGEKSKDLQLESEVQYF